MCVMIKELTPANLCFKWACLVLGENHLATHRRRDVPLSILPLTDVEGMIYHIRPRPFTCLGLQRTFQTSSVLLFLCVEP